MRESSAELRETLDRMHSRQESVNAVVTIKENIEGFNSNAEKLHMAMERFDGTVEHTFDKIDSEMGEVVKKLSTFASLISEQNQMILENLASEKEDETKTDV
jgi:cytochrome c556